MTEPPEASGLKWEEPPPQRGGRKRPGTDHLYEAEAAELRANPSKWALLGGEMEARHAVSLAAGIRRGKYRSFPIGEFDAQSRTKDGAGWVYVCYIGPRPLGPPKDTA